ncbi:bifunctional DNA primase/polymerase [Paractinoplanes atraurantiacus]|uniref:Bifunctional DNA primase/polymerase, N-terminal n=1 Tax=Paractinoplanes atraurantiacus TaxID=1036182 RepID=A0A285H0L4_9ACTN|nr:bifunctional DNA primase/polymerase [Actinoplanes atraurantiacus]SNY29359.1 Bifunctional DNA primase/polymerase, N-terminal [Actinoplanes atraurantiacus]
MLLTAALAYARHGIPVLPVHTAGPGGCSCDRGARCDHPGKHPHLRHGLTEATTDPRLIDLWWHRWPEANVGLRTGVVMDVADVDSEEGWHGLCHVLGGSLPGGPLVRTGSGGWHFWFHPTGFGNRVRLLPGLDWRGSGGYVVAPPSRHVSGGDYRWVHRPVDDLPSGPPALRELIEGPPPPPHRRQRQALIAHPDRYARAALTAECDRVARAHTGTRNDTLNRAAFALGRLVGAGLLDAAEATRALETAAGFAGLGRAETRATIRSGMTAGRRTPFIDRTPRAA